MHFNCLKKLEKILRGKKKKKSGRLTFEGFNRLVEAALEIELWKEDLKIELS